MQRKSGLTKKRRKQRGEEDGRNMVWKGRQMNRKWINEQEINVKKKGEIKAKDKKNGD